MTPPPVGLVSPKTYTKFQMVAHLRDLVARVRHANSFMPREVSDEVRELEAAIAAVEEELGALIDDMLANRYRQHYYEQRRLTGRSGRRVALTVEEERARQHARRDPSREVRQSADLAVHAAHVDEYGRSADWCQHPDCVAARRPVLQGARR